MEVMEQPGKITRKWLKNRMVAVWRGLVLLLLPAHTT